MDNVEMQRAATALADRLVPPVVARDSAAWYAAVDVALIALRAAHDAGRAEGEGSADSLRARLAYVQGGQEQVAAVSAWLAVSTVREVVIGRTKDGSGIRAQAQVWEGAGRVEAECVGEDVALALEALGAALK